MPKPVIKLHIDVSPPPVLSQIQQRPPLVVKASAIANHPKNFGLLSPKMQEYLADIDEVIEERQEESSDKFDDDPVKACEEKLDELKYYQKRLNKVEKKAAYIESTQDVIRQNYELIKRLLKRRLDMD